MRQILASVLSHLFGILVFIAVLIGALVAVLFIIGFVIGGPAATHLALTSKTLLDDAIRIAAVGVLFGLVNFYVDGKHELTLQSGNGGHADPEEPRRAEKEA